MVRWGFDYLFTVGSVGFAALSLTLPFPLLNTPQDKIEDVPKQVVVQQPSTIPRQEVEEVRKAVPDTPRIADAPKHIITPLTKDQAVEGLVLALSQPADVVADTDSEAKIAAEPHRENNEPSVAIKADQESLVSVQPVLPMPETIAEQEDEDLSDKQERLFRNVAPSLLLELDQPLAKTEKPQEKVVERVQVEEVKKLPVKEPVIGEAERIEVPSIAIDIAVRPGTYDPNTQTWTVDDSAAFVADTTVPVNDTNGTTLIYGHAKWGIFGALPDLQPGAEAIVHAAGGSRFVYTFESVSQVEPSDLSMLTAEGEPRLVLQTCSGLFDQHRTLALFALKEVTPKSA